MILKRFFLIFLSMILLIAAVASCTNEPTVIKTGDYGNNLLEEDDDDDDDDNDNDDEIPEGGVVSIAALRNPERGYNLESNYFVHNLENPFHGYTYPEMWIPWVETSVNAARDSLTLTQLYLYITDYVGKDVDQNGIDNMQTLFDSAKELGYKIHLVYAYDDTEYATAVSFTDIFNHLDNQIKPFIADNLGMVALWRMGFIGTWGEGNNTNMKTDWANKTKLVQHILAAYPDRYMALRYPSDLAKFTSNGLTEAQKKFVGFTNDYFTASEHSHAPGNDYTFGSDDYALVKSRAPYVQVVGEIPYDEDTQWGLHTLISVENSIKALKEHHYSALDVTQNNGLNFANWKTYPLYPSKLRSENVLFDKSYFKDETGRTVKRSAYEFIRDHLGYRLYIDHDLTVLTASGGTFNYDFTVYNTGFSTILHPRPAKLVLIQEDKTVAQVIDLATTDPRDWQPYDPAKEDYKQIYHKITGNATIGLTGKYKVGLWLPDPTDELKNLPLFTMVFANTDVIHTNEARFNILGEVEF